MATRTIKRLGNNRAFICVKQNNKLVLKPVIMHGSVRVIAGKEQGIDKLAQFVYDFRQQSHRGFFPLELLNGGEYDEQLHGYKNWFPGSHAFGFIRDRDAPVVDINKQQIYDEFGNAVYVPMYGGLVTIDEAMVEILDVLDDAMLDYNLKVGWNIYYKIKTSSGIIGYISALSVANVVYRI